MAVIVHGMKADVHESAKVVVRSKLMQIVEVGLIETASYGSIVD